MAPITAYARKVRRQITLLLKNSTGTTRQLAERFNIPETTIRRWKKSEKSPRKSWVTRKPASTAMEKELVGWTKARRERGLKVSTRDLRDKAMQLSTSFSLVNFQASRGWIQNVMETFFQRHSFISDLMFSVSDFFRLSLFFDFCVMKLYFAKK